MTIMIPAWVEDVLQPVEKLDAHKRGLRHKAVSVFVLCGSDVLIQRRALSKYHTPGLWANTCCTHPGWDETAEACAHRRLREELGIEGLRLSWQGQVSYRADVGGGLVEDEQVDIFLSRVPERIAVTPNPEEVMDTAWVSRRDLEERIAETPDAFTPWLRIYLDRHAGTIFQ